MNDTILEFTCIGIENNGKFPLENTGRGQDISPEFLIKNLSSRAKTAKRENTYLSFHCLCAGL